MAPKQRKERSRSPVKKVEEPKKEEPKEEVKEEEKKFVEADAPKCNRPVLKEKIGFETADTTLNVVPTVGGKVLTCLTDAGMANLIACARANGSQKSGRYMFEAKIIQVTDPSNGQQKGSNQLMRIGFSTASSGLFLDDASSIYFDSEGFCTTGKKRTQVKNGRIGKNQVAAVVLNLDAKSPNNNTIALYRDGVAVGEPVPLPEGLQGKPLFPHLAFRSVSLRVNFGPDALKPLPFACRMLQGAAASDATVSLSTAPKDGKYEVMMPVAFPDEGTFEWLDEFLEKNPTYVELSDRALKEWAASSGLGRNAGGCNDKPKFNFGIPSMDNNSLQKIVSAVAPLSARNYVIMEVKANLIKAERENTLKRFNPSTFKRVARVMMGEPKEAFRKKVLAKFLKVKQAKVTAEWNQKKRKQEQQKIAAQKKKEAEEKRKKLLEEAAKKKAEAEAKKKAEAEAKKAAEEKKDDEKEGEKKDEEMKDAAEPKEEKKEEKKEEPKEEEPKEEEKEKEPEPMEDLGDEPPVAELTEEEQKICFTPKVGAGDLTQKMLDSSFSQFSLPDKEESFDDIKYEWQSEAKAGEYLKTWLLQKKATTRIEGLTPSQYFKDKIAAWSKQFKEWEDKQKSFKAAGKKKDNKDQSATDIFAVENINDTGGGEPLYASFEPQDWALLQLRYEFYLLLDAFRHDVNDPDRENIPEAHIGFYYSKYYSKQLNAKMFTLDSIAAMVKLVKDTAVIDEEKKQLKSALSDVDSLDIFVKLGEESRRERQRRLDAGDETARLKYVPPAAPPKVATPKPAVAKPAAAKPAAAKPAAGKPPAVAAPKAAVPNVAVAAPKAAGAQANPLAGKGAAQGWNNAQGSKGAGGQSWKGGDGGQSWKGGGGAGGNWQGAATQNWKGGGGGDGGSWGKGGGGGGNWGNKGGGGGQAWGGAGAGAGGKGGKGGKGWGW